MDTVFILFSIVLLLFVGAIFWNQSLRTMIRKKTRQLDKALTEKKLAVEALQKNKTEFQEQKELFSKIFYSSPMGIAITSMDKGECIEVNEKFSSITGYGRDKSIGFTTVDLGFWENQEGRGRLICALKKDGAIKNKEIEFHKASGEPRFGNISIEVIKYNGEACLISALHDITDQKQTENELKEAHEKREKLIEKLEEALQNVKTLSGLIPICSSCKKIRDDKGYWNILESYIQENSEAQFSHGMCPECSEKLYGHQDWYKKRKLQKKEEGKNS